MTSTLVPIALVYFLYSFLMLVVRNSHNRKMVKIMIDNNLINGNCNGDFKFNFNLEDMKSTKSRLLPISLGLMGFALGLVIGALALPSIAKIRDVGGIVYNMQEAILVACPLFFASLGVLTSYIIERKEKK